jgi:hypothetical protein
MFSLPVDKYCYKGTEYQARTHEELGQADTTIVVDVMSFHFTLVKNKTTQKSQFLAETVRFNTRILVVFDHKSFVRFRFINGCNKVARSR